MVIFATMNKHLIKKAVDLLGSQVSLAQKCGVSQPAVYKWLNGGVITPENAIAVEKATDGAVTRCGLRPDVFGEEGTA